MKSKTIFTINPTDYGCSLEKDDLTILGVVSEYHDFTFVARINRFTKYKFVKSEDFYIWKDNSKNNDKFTSYYYNYKDKSCKIILINVKNNNNNTLISNWKDFTNIIVIVGQENKKVAEEILNKLKESEITHGEILPLETTQTVQIDLFGEQTISNYTSFTQSKYSLTEETLDNLLFSIDNYVLDLETHKKL